eukprot:7381612-Prymnesium_polylepis.1
MMTTSVMSPLSGNSTTPRSAPGPIKQKLEQWTPTRLAKEDLENVLGDAQRRRVRRRVVCRGV